MSEYAVEMRNITKSFPGIVANDHITLQLKKGEIHALLGENGAGKSVLMSILFGLYRADEGEILVNGEKVEINNPNDANDLGIGMVHQHFKLVECFSVLENIILGNEHTKNGFLRTDRAREKLTALSEKYQLHVDLDAKIEDITVGMQQRTEILKMLYRDNEILIFDEPTAVLTVQEIEEFIQILKDLAAEGKSILFITHKLNEIMAAADRCTVIRKGSYVGTVDISQTTSEALAEMMVGRQVSFKVDKKPANPGEVILDVQSLTIQSKNNRKNVISDVSFKVHKGEIVCIAGIDGNGQRELIYGLTGLMPITSGKVLFNGEEITRKSVRERALAGISHVPEDRHKHGLILDFTLEKNLILQRYFEPEFTDRFSIMNRSAIRAYNDRLSEMYDIRSGQGASTIVRTMSGGNQQKAIIAREMDKPHDLLIVVQPTRGVDVGAIEFIHRLIIQSRDAGKAVLMVSLELDEVMKVPDRIVVLHEGQVMGEFDPEQTTMRELGLYMTGARKQQVIP